MRVEETHDIAACQAIRRAVFIQEQGVAEADELDGHDPDCHHYLLWDGAHAIGTLRVKPVADDLAKIQRVAILKPHRGRGAGAVLMRMVLKELPDDGYTRVILGSQLTALEFYQKLGFAPFGPIYDDAGIQHRDMGLTLGPPNWD
jgi:predicted GNAT family N-acyltransferase